MLRRIMQGLFTAWAMDPKRWGRASRYTPHMGAKERERAKRCYESLYLNERAIDQMLATGGSLVFHNRCSPTICQQSWRAYRQSMGDV